MCQIELTWIGLTCRTCDMYNVAPFLLIKHLVWEFVTRRGGYQLMYSEAAHPCSFVRSLTAGV